MSLRSDSLRSWSPIRCWPAILLLLVTGLSCDRNARAKQLRQHYQCEASYSKCAQLIVVARIKSRRDTGFSEPKARADFSGPDRLSLFEVAVEVENVLKGEFPGKTLTYYFYGHPLNIPLVGVSPHEPESGERYVLALTYDAGTLRTVVDYVDWPHHRMFSGSHAATFIRPQWTVGERIARVILTPGAGVVDDDLAQHVDRACQRAESEGGPLLTMELLKSLLEYSGCNTRSSACLLLAQRYPGHDSCLARVVLDSCLADVWERALYLNLNIPQWLAHAKERDASLAAQLAEGTVPGTNLEDPWYLQRLEILKEHPDPHVAARAALLQKVPHSKQQ